MCMKPSVHTKIDFDSWRKCLHPKYVHELICKFRIIPLLNAKKDDLSRCLEYHVYFTNNDSRRGTSQMEDPKDISITLTIQHFSKTLNVMPQTCVISKVFL
jgi:hypothetical protein